MDYTNKWRYKQNDFESEHINGFYGFVYVIKNLQNDKYYIGRKYFWSVTKVKGKRKRVRKESKWKEYYSSCDSLKRDIERLGKSSFSRTIISLHKTKGQVNYNETKLLFGLDVINDNNAYNSNILGRYYKLNQGE